MCAVTGRAEAMRVEVSGKPPQWKHEGHNLAGVSTPASAGLAVETDLAQTMQPSTNASCDAGLRGLSGERNGAWLN
jgi:hypothetical protein